MIALVWFYGGGNRGVDDRARARRGAFALTVLVGGVIVSGGLYLGFKNRPGAYQGSPSFYMDPSQPNSGFASHVDAGTGPLKLADGNRSGRHIAFLVYGASLEKLLEGYYVLDRNYNYHFHNELFVRSTPLLPNYRTAGLDLIGEARRNREAGDRAMATLSLDASNPVDAFLMDVRDYVAYNFERAATLERMSAEFEKTKAGLQHATHIYEGEGKYLGVQLSALVQKHGAVLTDDFGISIAGDFAKKAAAIEAKYANRIVGF
jgi:hypothetical protein